MTAATGTAPTLGLREYLDAVGASGILAEPQLKRLADLLPAATTTAEAAARWMLADGMLTKYQAERLLAGRPDGMVLGPYVVLDLLGRNDAGKAFKVRHRTMDRTAVVKVLAPDLTRTEVDRAAVEAEARAAARLAHPNVVTVLDMNTVGDRQYLVREFVDGSAADAVVRANGPMPATLACDVVRQAALGLQHAHEKGIVHGRVCPSNLIVGWENSGPTVKVTNFGLGRLTGLTAGAAPPGAGADPADYLAPERTAGPGGTPTIASDLYALGATLYFLLTGDAPFPGRDAAEKAERHRIATLSDVDLKQLSVPVGVMAVMRDMMAKQPVHRPSSAAEVAARLQAYVEPMMGLSVATTAPAPGGEVVTTPRQCPWDGIGGEAQDVVSSPKTRRKIAYRTTGHKLISAVMGWAIAVLATAALAAGAVIAWRMRR